MTKRIGVVDLGDLSYSKTSSGLFQGRLTPPTKNYYADAANAISPIFTCIPTGPITGPSGSNPSPDMVMALSVSTVYINYLSTTDVDVFKTAMSGVPLYYELATPEEYLLDTPIPANYLVNALGTEKRLPEDTASAVTAPIILTTRYSMDAVGTLNGLPTGYISESSMDAFLTEFASKIGAAIGKTITATKTFDVATNKYNFTITVTNPS